MNALSRIAIVHSEFPLKPCPQCGTPEVRLIRVTRFAGGDDAYYVACTVCAPRQFPDRCEDAVRDWNQRREPRKPSKEAVPA